MSLDLGKYGFKNLFKHSKEFNQGQGKVRKGQSSIIVSLDGTGDTNDIQDGINMLNDTGGTIYIKEGIYNLKQGIIINKSNIRITGAGKSTEIKGTNSFAAFSTETTAMSLIENLKIDNIYISGGSNLIHLFNAKNAKIENCWFANGSFEGIYATDGTTNLFINNCFLENSYGFNIDAPNSIIQGNYLNNTTEQGIISSSNCIIKNNQIINSGLNGIFLGKGSSGGNLSTSIINGNIIKESGESGILIEDNTDRICINGNISINNSKYGIYINQRTKSADKNLVIGNIFYNNTLGQFNDNGTNTLPNGSTGTTNLQQDDLNILS